MWCGRRYIHYFKKWVLDLFIHIFSNWDSGARKSSSWAWLWFYFSLENSIFSCVQHIFNIKKNCFTAIFMSDNHLTTYVQIKYQSIFDTFMIIYTFIAALFFHKSYIPVFTNSINHNRTIMFYQNPSNQALPSSKWVWPFPKQFSHRFWFHLRQIYQGLTNILIFCHSRPN